MTREQRLDVAARGLLALIGHSPVKVTPNPTGTYNERVEALFAALGAEPAPRPAESALAEARAEVERFRGWLSMQKEETSAIFYKLEAAESQRDRAVEVLRRVESIVGQARALVKVESDDRPLQAIQQLVASVIRGEGTPRPAEEAP